jgi:hypothetical protein
MAVAEMILADARGYGTVVAEYVNRAPIHVERVAHPTAPLAVHLAATFVDSTYCHVISRAIPHLYRVWDTNETRTWKGPPHSGALLLGKPGAPGLWLSPMRPEHLVDYRELTAIKHEWDRMDFVLDASLAPGASVYVGRTAPQTSHGKVLHGGAMQLFLPKDQFGYLTLNRWWVVR